MAVMVFVSEGTAPVTQTRTEGETPVIQKPKLPEALPEEIEEVVRHWEEILGDLGGLLRNYLKTARPSIGNGNVLLIVTDDTVAHGILSEAEHVQEIKETIERNIGRSIELEIRLNDTGRPFEESYVDISQMIRMDIEEEDEEGGF